MPRLAACLMLVYCLVLLAAVRLDAGESATASWPQWRGPFRDGISRETDLARDWNVAAPRLEWTATGLGKGYASVSIAEGRIFTTGDFGDQQKAVALDLTDGKNRWQTAIGPAGGIGRPGARCTPTIDGDRLYVLGSKGDLHCLRVASGETLWQRDLVDDFDGRMMSGWGFTEAPLVDGERLICTPGGPDATIVALDKMSGEEVWRCAVGELGSRGRDGAGYASALISEACGVRQYVQLLGRGVVGVAAADGRFLWGYNRIANRTANIPSPIIRNDYVFCSTGYRTGAALLRITGDARQMEAEEVYFLPAGEMQNHHGGMVLIADHIYCGTGHNQGFPLCVELMTGEIAWFAGRGPGTRSAAVVYADGHLYFRYENGIMALIEATPEDYRLKGTFEIPNVQRPSWSHPVVAGGHLYLREQDALYCYSLRP